MEGRKCFINDALNTFYLRLYGVRNMVKDHFDSERGNLLGYSFRLAVRVVLYMHHPTDRITHTMAFVTPVVEHWLEREIAQWVHTMKDRSDDPSHHERTLLPQSLALNAPLNKIFFPSLVMNGYLMTPEHLKVLRLLRVRQVYDK